MTLYKFDKFCSFDPLCHLMPWEFIARRLRALDLLMPRFNPAIITRGKRKKGNTYWVEVRLLGLLELIGCHICIWSSHHKCASYRISNTWFQSRAAELALTALAPFLIFLSQEVVSTGDFVPQREHLWTHRGQQAENKFVFEVEGEVCLSQRLLIALGRLLPRLCHSEQGAIIKGATHHYFGRTREQDCIRSQSRKSLSDSTYMYTPKVQRGACLQTPQRSVIFRYFVNFANFHRSPICHWTLIKLLIVS